MLCVGRDKRKKKADLKDLFVSTPPRMHDIFNLFIWAKQSFQQEKPMRHNKAQLYLAPTRQMAVFNAARTRLLRSVWLSLFVAARGSGSVEIIYQFLLFYCPPTKNR